MKKTTLCIGKIGDHQCIAFNVLARFACRFVCRFVCLLAWLPGFVTLRAYAPTDIPADFAFFMKAPGCFIALPIHFSAIGYPPPDCICFTFFIGQTKKAFTGFTPQRLLAKGMPPPKGRISGIVVILAHTVPPSHHSGCPFAENIGAITVI
jgi:hypothetical protein